MKKIIPLFLFLCFSWTVFAQLEKGHIKYDIRISADTEELKAAADMMGEMSMELFFAPGKSKVLVSMGMLMDLTTTVDADGDQVLILISSMMGQKAILSSLREVEKAGKDGPRAAAIILLDSTKTIAGYGCKKAVVKDTDGNEITYSIEVEKRGQENLNTDVPGFPMEFQTKQNGLNMTFIVREVIKTFNSPEEEIFSLDIPEGYDKMSLDDLMEGKG